MFVRKNEPQNPLPLVLVVLQVISKSVWSMAFFLYVKVRVDWHPIPELLLSHALLTSASAKREWLVTKRKGPWEGERKGAKPVFSFPPSFARKFSSRERETSGYETATGGSNNSSRCLMLLETGCSFPIWLIHIQALPTLFLVRAGGVGMQSDTLS